MAASAIIGACAGAGAIAIVGWLGEVAMKKEAMGFGDVTLMAVVGGIVLRVGNMILDASVRARLERLRRQVSTAAA